MLEDDSARDAMLDGGLDMEGRSVWDAALDIELIGLEDVGGKVEAADAPPGLTPPPPVYQPLSRLELRQESGLCRAARLDVVGLEVRIDVVLFIFSSSHIYTLRATMHKSCLDSQKNLILFSFPQL